jgi:hypothetical protein
MRKKIFLKTACLTIVFGLSVMNAGAQTTPVLNATGRDARFCVSTEQPSAQLCRDVACNVSTGERQAEVADYFPIASYTGGDVVVYTPEGKEAWRTSVKAGEKPNLSKLPAGEYCLRHGHRSIPIKKVN